MARIGSAFAILLLFIHVALAAKPGEQAAEGFLVWVNSLTTTPHQLTPGQQEALLAKYLDSAASPLIHRALSYKDYLALRSYLNVERGFSLSAPMAESDFVYRTVVLKWRPKQWGSPDPTLGADSRPIDLADERTYAVEVDESDVASPAAAATRRNGIAQQKLAQERQTLAAKGPAARVRLSPQLPHYYYFDKLAGMVAVDVAPAKRGEISFSLNQQGDNSLDLALELLASTPTGKKAVDQLLEKWAAHEIYVQVLTPGIRGQYPGPIGGLCWWYQGETHRTIFIDPQDTVGELAVNLYHEAFHALNPDHARLAAAIFARRDAYHRRSEELRSAFGKTRGRPADKVAERELPERDRRELEALQSEAALYKERATLQREREAHGAHEALAKEIQHVHSQTVEFFRYLNERGLLAENVAEEDLFQRYGLNRLRAQRAVASLGGQASPAPAPGPGCETIAAFAR